MLARMPDAIVIKDLRKSYGRLEAVRGIDLSVDEGEVFALLGPNGAGKTTTVEILEGYRRRDAGEVSVLGFDPGNSDRRFKERIGVVLQETGVEPYLTVAEVITMYGGYYPNPRPTDEVIEVVGLQEKRDERVGKLSGGQQRRLDVAVGLAGDPDLLFLDEPTTGFDPGARRGAWQMVKNLKALGKTVFLTTHYMDEAQNLADRVAIIRGGQIVAEGSPDELLSADDSAAVITFAAPAGTTLPTVEGTVREESGIFHVTTPSPVAALHTLTSWAIENDIELQRLSVTRPSLEDVYLQLTAAASDEVVA